jgi:hypothetical protein
VLATSTATPRATTRGTAARSSVVRPGAAPLSFHGEREFAVMLALPALHHAPVMHGDGRIRSLRRARSRASVRSSSEPISLL